MAPQQHCCIKTSFFHNVLSSLSTLQTTKSINSIRLPDLVKFMKYSYNLTGDVHSQVESVLNTAEDMNFVSKIKDRYSLIIPAAKVHLVPTACLKEEIKRVEEIFQTKKRRHSKTDLCSSATLNTRSKSYKIDNRSRSRSVSPARCPVPSFSNLRNSPNKSCIEPKPNKCADNSKNIFSKIWPAVCNLTKKKSTCTNTTPISCSCASSDNKRKLVAFKSANKMRKRKRISPCAKNSLEELKEKILNNTNNNSPCNLNNNYCSDSSSSNSSS